MPDTSFHSFLDKLAWALLLGYVVSMVTWNSWLTLEVNSRVSRSEIADLAPFSREASRINSELARLSRRIDGKFSDALTKNTGAIIRLETQFQSIQEDVHESIKMHKELLRYAKQDRKESDR